MLVATAPITTGSAQQLPNLAVLFELTLTAEKTNTAPISIGRTSTVTATSGFLLDPGASVTIQNTNANQLWAKCAKR